MLEGRPRSDCIISQAMPKIVVSTLRIYFRGSGQGGGWCGAVETFKIYFKTVKL